MEFLHSRERETLIDQVLAARTRPQIEAARTGVDAWMQKHPDDPGMEHAYSGLYMLEHALDTIDVEEKQQRRS